MKKTFFIEETTRNMDRKARKGSDAEAGAEEETLDDSRRRKLLVKETKHWSEHGKDQVVGFFLYAKWEERNPQISEEELARRFEFLKETFGADLVEEEVLDVGFENYEVVGAGGSAFIFTKFTADAGQRRFVKIYVRAADYPHRKFFGIQEIEALTSLAALAHRLANRNDASKFAMIPLIKRIGLTKKGILWMEYEGYGDGKDLGEYKFSNELLSDRLERMLKVARTLEQIHLEGKGFVFNDLKLTNVVAEDMLRMMLIDFFSLVPVGARSIWATHRYSPDEEMRDGRSDVFSFGRLLSYFFNLDDEKYFAFKVFNEHKTRHGRTVFWVPSEMYTPEMARIELQADQKKTWREPQTDAERQLNDQKFELRRLLMDMEQLDPNDRVQTMGKVIERLTQIRNAIRETETQFSSDTRGLWDQARNALFNRSTWEEHGSREYGEAVASVSR